MSVCAAEITSESVTANLYTGEVVYIYAFDVAYDMKRTPLQRLLGQPVQEYALCATKRSPRQLFFYRPYLIRLPGRIVSVGGDRTVVTGAVKVFNVGAVSVCLTVPFSGKELASLVDFHAFCTNGGCIEETATVLAREVLKELRPYCVQPVAELGPSEAYTVFRLQAPGHTHFQATTWFDAHRRDIANLLVEEGGPSQLSQQEVEESTQYVLSYYDNDLVVVDWDAALLMAEGNDAQELLHIMEVANVQLLELGVYDRLLDNATERAYRDMGQGRLYSRRSILRELREIRVDLARLSDELINTTKFFGDWHLARVYQHLYERFHLADWQHVIDQKLRALAGLYNLLQQDRVNLIMVVLEAAIVLLFVVDLILIFAHG